MIYGGFPEGQISTEQILRIFLDFVFALTIGKSFLNDFKRARISKNKLVTLLKFMTLTTGK